MDRWYLAARWYNTGYYVVGIHNTASKIEKKIWKKGYFLFCLNTIDIENNSEKHTELILNDLDISEDNISINMKASKNSEKIETEKQKIGNPWVSLNNTEKHILSSFLKEEDTKEVNPSFRILEVTNHFYLSSQILKFSELSTFGKAAYLSYTPLKWVAYLTILPTTKIFYSKTRCLIWSFSGIFFFSYIISNGSLLTN